MNALDEKIKTAFEELEKIRKELKQTQARLTERIAELEYQVKRNKVMR